MPTVEEMGDPDTKRTRRLTARALFKATESDGMENILIVRKMEAPFLWKRFGNDEHVFEVLSAYVVPLHATSAVRVHRGLAEQYLRVVLANTAAQCREAMLTNGAFNGRKHSEMHRTFTVVVVLRAGVHDVSRRFVMRSQSEAAFLVRHFELRGRPGTVDLTLTTGGTDNRRRQRAAKAKARTTRATRRRLGDAAMDPVEEVEMVDEDLGAEDEHENHEEHGVDGELAEVAAEEMIGDNEGDGLPVADSGAEMAGDATPQALDDPHVCRKELKEFPPTTGCGSCGHRIRGGKAWICVADGCPHRLWQCLPCHRPEEEFPSASQQTRAEAMRAAGL